MEQTGPKDADMAIFDAEIDAAAALQPVAEVRPPSDASMRFS